MKWTNEALAFPPNIAIYAGFFYFSLPISMNFTAYYYARKVKQFNNEKSPENT